MRHSSTRLARGLLAAGLIAAFTSLASWRGSAPRAAAAVEPPPPPAGAPPATAPAAAEKVGRFPHVEFNVQRRQVRVECQALAVDAPLEFFCVLNGTNEHESVLRTPARPSDIHTALLAVGLKPGEPLTFIESTKKWLPPHGPPLHVEVEFQKDGKTVSYPAYRWIRDIKTKKTAKAFTWVFVGSRVTKDGRYAADDTGYVMSLVNFDYTMIDVPQLASSSNDELEWERTAELMPAKGTTVWMVIEAAGGAAAAPGDAPAAQPSAALSPPTTNPTAAGIPADVASDVHSDEAKIQQLMKYHDQVLGPRAEAVRQAAKAHYEVITALRNEQQRLITEADRLQRAIDELEKRYADLSTPQPEGGAPPPPPPVPGVGAAPGDAPLGAP